MDFGMRQEVAPVERGKRWSGRSGQNGEIERRVETLFEDKKLPFLAQCHTVDVIFHGC